MSSDVTTKPKTTPAVGVALLAAAGTVWVVQQLPPSGSQEHSDDDRVIQLEATSSANAAAAFIASTNTRGEILRRSLRLSRLHVETIRVRAHETVDAVVVVSLTDVDRRRTIGCNITGPGVRSDPKQVTVRPGDDREVTCRYTG